MAYLIYIYLAIGLLIAIWFVFFDVHKVDHNFDGVRFLIKLIFVPGSILLWPILLFKKIKT